MAKLSTRARDRLPESAFAYPERRALPINDAAHVRAAIGRFASTVFPSMATARAAARRILRAARRFGVEISETSGIRKVAGKVQEQKRRGRNPSGQDGKALASAKRISKAFHGTDAEVVELEPHERKRPGRYAVVLGRLEDLTYAPAARSKRGHTAWRHESGDRGMGKPKSPNSPLVVVDPVTRRPFIVQDKSPMKMDPRRGLVG